MSSELTRIKRRWTTERKVAAADIEWLLKQAERAETMAAADKVRGHSSSLADLLRGFK